MEQDKKLTEQESLDLITQMINKAKRAYRDTGIGAIMWGSVVTVCSLVRFSEVHFGFELPFDIYWLTFIAIIPQVFLTIKKKKDRHVKTFDEPYLDYIWLSFGISIVLLIYIVNNVFYAYNPVGTRRAARSRWSASRSR